MFVLFLRLLLFCSSSRGRDINVTLVDRLNHEIEQHRDWLLEMMGIPTQPLPVNFTVPQYMEDLYKLLTSTVVNETVTSGAEKDVNKSLNAGSVHSLINRDNRQELAHLKQHLRFHTPAIVSEDEVRSAQLRLLRQVHESGSGELVARAMAYLVLGVCDLSGQDKLQLLDTLDLYDVMGDQWLVFDIEGAVREWVKCPGGTFELELHTELANETRVSPASVGVKKSSNTPNETIIVLFVNGDKMDVDWLSRMRRSQNVLLGLLGNELPEWQSMKKDLQRRDHLCQRREFYVDFKLLKWHSIISPRGYKSFVCSGMCPLTLSNNMNASHHARLQNIMHHKHPETIPPVACVPVKLSSLMVLYRTRNGGLVLKRMGGMIAAECGCQ